MGWWQVPEGGPGGLDSPPDAGDLVGPEVVGNDDVAWLQSRHQDLFDVSAEALAIDCAVEDPRCGQPCDPQRGEKRAGLPAPAGGVVVDARATRCPAVPPKQIGGDAAPQVVQGLFEKRFNGAKGRSYVFLVNMDNGKFNVVNGGVYDDVLVKEADGWRFKRRTFTPFPR